MLLGRGAQLDIKECRQWIKSRLETRGANPFEFVRTVPLYNPSQAISDGSLSGNSFVMSKSHIT